MASGDIDRDAEYALPKLLQMGTVTEYRNEFEMLIKRVTTLESLLALFYISEIKLELQRDLLRSRPTTLREAFSLARIVEAYFEEEWLTTKVLHQVFSLHRYVVKVVIFKKSARFQALIQFQSRHNVIAARNSLQGYNIYEGCYQLDIQFSNLEEVQPNHDENICYCYWENCILILNADEADNTKPPLSADIFGNNGGDYLESSGPVTPAEEILDSGHSFTFSSLVEHESPALVERASNLRFQKKFFMASGDIDRDAEYALPKLLQMGTVTEYRNEFEMLIKRVTTLESLLALFYIFEIKLELQRDLLRYVVKVVIFKKSARFQALIQFQSRHNAIAARNSLQG
nr:polypyrimidine tract-binding protein homolog 3 isoform X1 [Tanacetum cinerariifolium]